MVGTWIQMVAQGWLVLEITGSAFDVGLVAAASTLPTLFLSLLGGVIVDRYPRRTILLWTQSSAMLLAFILGIFALLGFVTMPIILVLSFLLGCVNALNVPALQAFLSEMVEREHLSSAIAMNSAIYNGSRIIGPAIAGFLIAAAGTGTAFIVNGFSFFAVIVSLLLIRSAGMLAPESDPVHPIEAIRDGLRYSMRHPLIRTIVIFIAIISIFGWSYVTMLPVIAKRSFHMDATGLGYLYGISGLGSVVWHAAHFHVLADHRPAHIHLRGHHSLFPLPCGLYLDFVASPRLFLPLSLRARPGGCRSNNERNPAEHRRRPVPRQGDEPLYDGVHGVHADWQS